MKKTKSLFLSENLKIDDKNEKNTAQNEVNNTTVGVENSTTGVNLSTALRTFLHNGSKKHHTENKKCGVEKITSNWA
jgi:hypothetical protein